MATMIDKSGERLKKARGLESVASVCAAVGISESALRMYEAGKRRPRDEIKARLARYYRTTVQALFFAD